MRTAIVIPARYRSTRLPGKPLADILGKPMVQHVYERACRVEGVARVVVATDDERIMQAVAAFGGEAVMTSPDHPSGTDRLVEVMGTIAADLYVNVQGDEPMLRPDVIGALIAGMRNAPEVDVGTLCHPIPAEEAQNPNSVKVVRSFAGDALYFSRAMIPYPRDHVGGHYLRHIGVYAYRRAVLAGYAALPRPEMETAEQLEQLRLLAAGIRIRVFDTDSGPIGVDTPQDLEDVRAMMAAEQSGGD